MGFVKEILEKIKSHEEGNKPAQYTYDANSQQYAKMKNGGKVSSASSRADGCAVKGKTKGRMI